ncbi:hypothetical protein KH400_18860 [Desertibacillus haloalkaliphilus]|nr:hypothetical protein [Desertibacillus haloalkaliphilus]
MTRCYPWLVEPLIGAWHPACGARHQLELKERTNLQIARPQTAKLFGATIVDVVEQWMSAGQTWSRLA